jgi:cell division protein FtsQ
VTKVKSKGGATKRRTPFPYKRWLLGIVRVFGVMCVVTLAGFALKIADGVNWQPLPLKNFEIDEVLVYQSDEPVNELLESYFGQSLLALDIVEIKTQLEGLPWVREASVLKEWPGNLYITLDEHEPVANWNEQAVLNSEGIPLEKPFADMKLADLHGPEGFSEVVMKNYLQFAQIFREQGFRLDRVLMRQRGAWTLTLSSGVEVYLGEKDVLVRSRRVVNVLNNDSLNEKAVNYIDARYPNGVAIKFMEDQELEAKNDIAA